MPSADYLARLRLDHTHRVLRRAIFGYRRARALVSTAVRADRTLSPDVTPHDHDSYPDQRGGGKSKTDDQGPSPPRVEDLDRVVSELGIKTLSSRRRKGTLLRHALIGCAGCTPVRSP